MLKMTSVCETGGVTLSATSWHAMPSQPALRVSLLLAPNLANATRLLAFRRGEEWPTPQERPARRFPRRVCTGHLDIKTWLLRNCWNVWNIAERCGVFLLHVSSSALWNMELEARGTVIFHNFDMCCVTAPENPRCRMCFRSEVT